VGVVIEDVIGCHGCSIVVHCCSYKNMSRIYDNKPLSALSVENIAWKTEWCPNQYQSGPGVLVEGCVKGCSRLAIVDVKGKRARYTALYIDIRRAHRRKFDANGVEVEPNFSETEKVPIFGAVVEVLVARQKITVIEYVT